MFLLFSPYSFMFLSLYLFFMLSLPIIRNFYFFWLVMELLILLFIGLSYTVFLRSYSQLITYFLIQVLSSFFILTFYIFRIPIFLTISFLIKLSMFPFFFWYINLLYRFPNFIFWLARTIHKVPAMFIIKIFIIPINMPLLWFSILLTTFFSGLIMLSMLDFRIVLVISSIGNNSWFILSQICNFAVFLIFLFTYSFSLFFVFSNIKEFRKPSLYKSLSSKEYPLAFWVFSLSGIPPFPIFYSKIIIILTLLSFYDLSFYFGFFLLLNSIMVIGYVQSLLRYYIFYFSTYSHYFFKY